MDISNRRPQSEEVAAMFYKKKLLKFGVEKLIKTKGDKLYVKWNCYDNWFHCWIDKKDIIVQNELFPESRTHRKTKIKVELDFINYATKSNIKGATCIDTSKFAKGLDLANRKYVVYGEGI